MTGTQDFVKMVDRRTVGLDATVLARDVSEFLADALELLDRYRPRFHEYILTGDGSDEYVLASGSGWEDGFSEFDETRGVRFVPEANFDDPPQYEKPHSYEVAESSDGGDPTLHLGFAPTASDRVVLRFTKAHAIDASSSSVAAQDESAVADLAASFVFEGMATYANRVTPQGLDLDSIVAGQNSRPQFFEDRARTLRERFEVHVGIRAPSGGGGASAGDVGAHYSQPENRPTGALSHRHTHRR